MDSQPSGLDAVFAELNQMIAQDQGVSTPEPEQELVADAVSDVDEDANLAADDDAESSDDETVQADAAPDTSSAPDDAPSTPQAATDATPQLPPDVLKELEEGRAFRSRMEGMIEQARQQSEQRQREEQARQQEQQQRQVMAERLAWMRDNVPEDRQAEYVAQLNNEVFARPVMQQAQAALYERDQMLEDAGATATAVYIAAQKFLSEPERLIGLTPEQRKDAFKSYVSHLRQNGANPQAMQGQVEFENSIRADERKRVMAEVAQGQNKKAAARKNARVASGVDTVPSNSGAPAKSGNQSELDRVLSGVFGN